MRCRRCVLNVDLRRTHRVRSTRLIVIQAKAFQVESVNVSKVNIAGERCLKAVGWWQMSRLYQV